MRPRLPAIVSAVAGVAFVLATSRLNAQERVTVNCAQYSAFAARVAEYREVGAPLARVLNKVRQDNPAELVRRLLAREAARVYAEGRPPEEAAHEAFRRCAAELGELEPLLEG